MTVLPTDVFAFMYHEVTDDPSTSGLQRPGARPYTLSPAAFRGHLDAIAARAFTPRLVGDADGVPGPHVLLTFDDGGWSALHTAEMLSTRGWRGHFFIVTAWIGRPGFLDERSIREIRALGHLVGSHSHTHPDIFRALLRRQMLAQWRRSRDVLADVLGEPCVAASVPGGDSSPDTFATAEEAGVRWLFTSEPWRRPRDAGGCRVFGRLTIKASVTPTKLAEYLRGRGWARALLVRRLKDVARRGVGPLYRTYVRRTTRTEPRPV